MSTTDRCSCPDSFRDDRPGIDPTCPAHGDVDAILASGRYVDRRGVHWKALAAGQTWGRVNESGFAIGGVMLTPDQMRLLIERDRHRDECPGLNRCWNHPVPKVAQSRLLKDWMAVYAANAPERDTWYPTLAEAFAAAEKLVKGQDNG
ncbi:hypothetical protein DFO66_103354 [Brevibacterium sanguinis]|uniref:Uncharacterized protein n=2 Tax=Brevibacterium TaxID=1696 RepID=A0A366INZ1_9MICO|nr:MULTISPECIES: hypothetical protein [Brevibacterium]RBP66407.1 hypothetical protein DFO66_103354 [Brevibacterium sanguinis]RBP73059.1 hypothetical protein DFO65_103354 [Brevibacterium celere]